MLSVVASRRYKDDGRLNGQWRGRRHVYCRNVAIAILKNASSEGHNIYMADYSPKGRNFPREV